MSHGSIVLKGLVVATIAIIFMVGVERRRAGVHPVRRIAEAPVSRPQNLPPGVTPAKWNAIQHTLTQRSLEAVSTPAGRTVLQSPRLRGEFDETALRLAPVRKDSTEPWSVRWGWCRREGQPATPVQVTHRGNKVYVAAEGISETFENRRSGIEHSFRVNGPAVDDLRVRVDVETSLIATTASSDRIVFTDGAGNEVMEYAGLKAWDAKGRTLEASLEADGGDVLVSVNTAGAAFPVTVDPLLRVNISLQGSDWTITDQGDQQPLDLDMGWAVTGLGDIDGNGDTDVAIGVPGFNNDEGRVFVFMGQGAFEGIDAGFYLELMAYAPQVGARFGASLAGGADVNGDGDEDLVVGSPWFDTLESENAGALYLFLGDGTAFEPVVLVSSGSNEECAEFGAAVSMPGSFDDDALVDVFVGAPGIDSDAGAVYMFLGEAGGVNAAVAWVNLGPEQAGARYGAALSKTMGDYDGDGEPDVVVGAPGYDVTTTSTYSNAGAIWGFTSTDSAAPPYLAYSWDTDGPEDDGAQFGFSVDLAGDINDDDDDDLVVGSPTDDNDGTVYVYWGILGAPPGGLTNPWVITNIDGGQLGFCVASGGDIDGGADGDEVLVGAPYVGGNNGSIYVLSWDAGTTSLIVEDIEASVYSGAEWGFSVAAIGDANDDGMIDVLVGTPGVASYTTPESGGAVVLYAIDGPTVPGIDFMSYYFYPDLGFSIAYAGDVNNDGYDDLLVGAPNAINEEGTPGGAAYLYFGSATGPGADPVWSTWGEVEYGAVVAGVGDVNGDGIADIMVGDPGYAGSIGTDAGRVYLYLGIDDDIPSTCPTWMSSGDEQIGARFGASIAGLGNINQSGGDEGDIIVGAPLYDDTDADPDLENTGRIYVYAGDATYGMLDTPLTYLTGLQDGEQFGFSVAGPGDLNGDTFPDAAMGAPYVQSGVATAPDGAAFVFFGGDATTGFDYTLTAWSSAGTFQAGAEFGWCVAGVGDVDGDTIADLAVGAPGYSSNVGRVFVYTAFDAGLGTATALWNNGFSGNRFGVAITGIGDLDSDGFSDFAVGTVGGVTGFMAGVVMHFDWTGTTMAFERVLGTEINGNFRLFGTALAGMGDINGDTIPDLFVGTPGPVTGVSGWGSGPIEGFVGFDGSD